MQNPTSTKPHLRDARPRAPDTAAPRACPRGPSSPGSDHSPRCLRREAARLRMMPVSVKKHSSKKKYTCRKTSFQSAKSGAGEQCLLPDCLARARGKGVFSSDTGSALFLTRVSCFGLCNPIGPALRVALNATRCLEVQTRIQVQWVVES